MAAPSRPALLSLYKQMLRESAKFQDFNFRAWAIRRVRDEFKAGAALQDAQKIQQQFNWANENLNIIKRQTTIGQLFSHNQKLSVEVNNPKQ